MLKDNLLTLRKPNHYSQETAAENIGVSRQTLAKWETVNPYRMWTNAS